MASVSPAPSQPNLSGEHLDHFPEHHRHDDTQPLIAAHHADHDVEHGDTSHGQIPLRTLPSASSPSSKAIAASSEPYTFKRYYARSTLNTLGPLLVTGFYLFIVVEYFLRPAVNDVSPDRLVNGKAIFFAWLILSIFLLDWAKSGLAGFEAAALMKPRWAPATAMQLMWHLDRSWGGLSGWWKASVYTIRYCRSLSGKMEKKKDLVWDGPGGLWWYLALSSFLFYAAVPLAGLSMDIAESFSLSDRPIAIIGSNASTFDARTNSEVADLARGNWKQGRATTPLSPTILYAPQDTQDVSSTYYEDTIQAFFQEDLAGHVRSDRTVTVFAGPAVAERAHGTAWGLLTKVSCAAADVYSGLQLIKVVSPYNWSIPVGGLNSVSANNQTVETYGGLGLLPGVFLNDSNPGVTYYYLLASDRDMEATEGEYGPLSIGGADLPLSGSVEMVMWQALATPIGPDAEFNNMTRNPLVQSDGDYLGYGVQCNVSTDVGFAYLDARTQTFSNFVQQRTDGPPASVGNAETDKNPIWDYSGLDAVQTIVLAALSYIIPGYMSSPGCMPAASAPSVNPTCNVFYSANQATGGIATLTNVPTPGEPNAQLLRQPAIGPERMTLAMYKIFGEVSIAMMAVGSGNWTSMNLTGLAPITDLKPGRIPWQVVLAFLVLWSVITVAPQCWTFAEKRWSSTLEAFELFRFGAEWRDAVQQFESNEFNENTGLRSLPGMVGDMEPRKQEGFIGLSRVEAKAGRAYVNYRGDVNH